MTTGRTQWLIADRSMATIGDRVILVRPANTPGVIVGVDRHTGVPAVKITGGPKTGHTVGVWPTQIATITRGGTSAA